VAPRRVEIRLALSHAAAEVLGEPRVRRLVEIELDDAGTLAPGMGGPLGDDVAQVWIDLPRPAEVLIEARLAERPVTRRIIAIGGLSADVAARLVAIATTELVRAQTRPLRPRRQPTPRRPTPEEIERVERRAPAVVWSAAPGMAWLPTAHTLLGGAGASFGFRAEGASERVFARWLTGPSDGGVLRWFEAGLLADYRISLHRHVRLQLGATAALAALRLGDVRATDGLAGARDTWSGRASGLLGLDVRVLGPVWLNLALSPGAVLRPAPFEDASGRHGAIEGLWLGFDLGLQIDHVLGTATNGH
jgi:hypothetical protein